MILRGRFIRSPFVVCRTSPHSLSGFPPFVEIFLITPPPPLPIPPTPLFPYHIYIWRIPIYLPAPPLRPDLLFLLRAATKALRHRVPVGLEFAFLSGGGGVVTVLVRRKVVQFDFVTVSIYPTTRIGNLPPPHHPSPPNMPSPETLPPQSQLSPKLKI